MFINNCDICHAVNLLLLMTTIQTLRLFNQYFCSHILTLLLNIHNKNNIMYLKHNHNSVWWNIKE